MINTQELPLSKAKQIIRLHTKKYRQQSRLFLIEGVRGVNQAIQQKNLSLKYLVIQENTNQQIVEDASLIREINIYKTTTDEFNRISATETNQGVLLVAEIPDIISFDNITPKKYPFILIADGIRDPGNLGTMYRTAAWLGVDAIISAEKTVDLFNPKCIRSTAGAIGSIPFSECLLESHLPELRKRGYEIVALGLNEEAISLYDFNPKRGTALITGNEAHGLSDAAKQFAKSLYIPGNTNKVESLNASVAASLAISHIKNNMNPKTN